VFLYNFTPNHNPFIPSITKILKGVTNCDVRIFWDGLQDFQYDINSYDFYLPTISVFAPGYFDKYNFIDIWGYEQDNPKKNLFALNIHQTRIQFCMINLLFIGNETLLQTPTHDTQYYYIKQSNISISFYFTMAYNHYLQFNGGWCESLSNIYTILVTNFTEIIDQNKIRLLAYNYNYVEYFAIIFPSESKNSEDLKICVAIRTREADLSNTICENFKSQQQTVIEIINEKWIHSPYWFYKELKEEETDPFDRFSNKSIDLYIFMLVARNEKNNNVTIYTRYLQSEFPWRIFHTFPVVSLEDFNENRLNVPIQYQVFVQSTGLKWLTCYENTYMGFGFYLSPFQLNLWIGFGITMISQGNL
jgi:hypothetical protein